MAARLGTVCRQARQDARLRAIDIATAAGVSEATVSRFEKGTAWSWSTDALVAAYEHECHLPDGELWRRAVSSY